MKVLLPIAMTLLLLLLGGCSGIVENLCRYDADCESSQYCVDLQCVDACGDDSDCAEGRRCLSYQRSGEVDPVDACLVDDREPSEVQCESDQQCRDELNSARVFCGLDGRCAYRVDESDADGSDTGSDLDADQDSDMDSDVIGDTALVLLLEQVWPEDEDFEESDAGADVDVEEGADAGEEPVTVLEAPVRIGAVIARSPGGSAEAYGRVLANSDPTAAPYLQPAPVALDASETCVKEASIAGYSSLGGPGGWMLVEFVDGYGDRVLPQQDWSVEIIAESPLCPLGYEVVPPADLAPGSYRARLCEGDPEGIDRERDCGPPQTEARQGFTEFVVTL